MACGALALGVMAPAPSMAAEHGAPAKGKDAKPADAKPKEKKAPPPQPKEGEAGIGYGGAKVQLQPLMSPYKGAGGRVQYQVITVRLVLDVGVNEKPACFMIPIIQEKLLLYLAKKQPRPEDLTGQRKDVFLKEILDVATAATDRGFYSGVELVDETSPELDPKSRTLSTQCK